MEIYKVIEICQWRIDISHNLIEYYRHDIRHKLCTPEKVFVNVIIIMVVVKVSKKWRNLNFSLQEFLPNSQLMGTIGVIP